MNKHSYIFFIFGSFLLLSTAWSRCFVPSPESNKTSLTHKGRQDNFTIEYQDQFFTLNFRFYEPRGHRSRPGDIVSINNNEGDLLIAWGDLGLVKYSRQHRQIIDVIPFNKLISNKFQGEIVTLKKGIQQDFQMTIFNDQKMRFEKFEFALSPLKIKKSTPCRSIQKISTKQKISKNHLIN